MNNILYYKDKLVALYNGDSRSMKELNNESIGFIVTSPPYWDLKNYNHKTQIGLGQSYKEYLCELKKVFNECYRVLNSGKFFALVIGTRISNGDLKHIPMDCISLLKDIGFILKKEIIWVKPKGTQGLWQRGTTKFLKKTPYPGCVNINIQHEFILIFQKEGEFKHTQTAKLSEKFIKDVCWSVWELKVSQLKGHPAPFPLELPLRLIKMFSNPEDVVLDPFWGIGTTSLAARMLGRKSIGYEISENYCRLGVENLR
jgi:DNA modification methylase